MNIALVIPYNPLQEIGGLEIGALRHAKGLELLGHSVTIISKGKTGYLDNIEIIGFANIALLSDFLINHSNIIDIIHWLEIFPEPGEVETQCKCLETLKVQGNVIVFMVATSGNLKKRGSGPKIIALLKENVDAFIISNNSQVNEFNEFGITENIFDFGFGIDTTSVFSPLNKRDKNILRDELNLPSDRVICLFLGRFVERKRPDFLLKAWSEMHDLQNVSELVIVGSGMGQDDSIEDSVTELISGQSNVKFRDIALCPEKYLQASDILLLPSSREGQPNVLMEAMACSTVVIGSDIPGINELIEYGVNGFTFSVNDIEEFKNLVRSCIRLRNSEKKRIGQAARDLIVSKKDISLVTERYVQLYANMME